PARVPGEYRMEMKAGYAPTKLCYDNIAARIGLDKTSGGRGTAVFDYNNDGLLDIVITSTQGGCNLYRNNGDGTFQDVSIESGLDSCINGFAVTAGDYDNDGDVTFTDMTDQAGLRSVFPTLVCAWGDYNNDGYPDLFLSGVGHAQLFRNKGDGTFTDVSEQAGFTELLVGATCFFYDYDHD